MNALKAAMIVMETLTVKTQLERTFVRATLGMAETERVVMTMTSVLLARMAVIRKHCAPMWTARTGAPVCLGTKDLVRTVWILMNAVGIRTIAMTTQSAQTRRVPFNVTARLGTRVLDKTALT